MSAKYALKLYIKGKQSNSQKALTKLQNLLDIKFKDLYELKVIDVLNKPHILERFKILARPYLPKGLPPPIRRIIRDLSEKEKVLLRADIEFNEEAAEKEFIKLCNLGKI